MKRKKTLALFCCTALTLSAMQGKTISHAAQNSGPMQEYLVQTNTEQAYEAVAQQYGVQTLSDLPAEPLFKETNILLMDLTSEQAYVLDQEDGVTVEPNMTLNAADLTETTLEEDRSMQPAAEDVKSLAERQWNLSAVQAESVDETAAAKKINIAILDSGVDLLGDVEFDYQTSLIPEENTDDQTGHGTMITNLIARNQNGFCETGIIPDSSPVGLYNVRILDENNQTPLSRVVEALQWCIDNHMDVVNMSFGMEEYSEILHNVISKAQDAGILMVASAGNSGGSLVEYPAGYPEVIAVGSVNENLTYSTFSNTGSAIELVAPGENIPVTSYWGLQGAGSGTSYAAAHVTAIAALLWSENPQRNAAEIRTLLNRSALDLGGSSSYGNGMVNYQYASTHTELADPESIVDEDWGRMANPQTYEVPDSLKASWGYDNHAALIPSSVSGLTAHEVNVVKAASRYSDTSETLRYYDALHARDNTNYVSAAKCMYEAALAWNTNKNYDDIYAKADSYYSSDESATVRATNIRELKAAMKEAVNCNFQNTAETGSAVTANRGRLQLLGLAIHIGGDTYAHKSMCDGSPSGQDEIQNIYNKTADVRNATVNGQNTIEDLKKAAASATGLTTAGMGNSKYFSNLRICNAYYTDSINYMAKRYSVATKVATNKLLNYYSNKTYFRPYAFCPYEISSTSNFRNNYSYKTRHLIKYLNDTGFNINSYLNGQNSYQTSDWYALSFDN
ncbi:MAG: S8 family serine peptidase [Eubacterium sp.]|nr:S8 family serine peptidase [Eubacterium sp.]